MKDYYFLLYLICLENLEMSLGDGKTNLICNISMGKNSHLTLKNYINHISLVITPNWSISFIAWLLNMLHYID